MILLKKTKQTQTIKHHLNTLSDTISPASVGTTSSTCSYLCSTQEILIQIDGGEGDEHFKPCWRDQCYISSVFLHQILSPLSLDVLRTDPFPSCK